jgi:cysteine desulfuration protein SufE
MKIKEIQDEIVDEFSMFDDWMERYEYIIQLGKPSVDQRIQNR